MNGDDERLVSRQVDAFIGVSSTQGLGPDEEPKLELAMERAAELAAGAGYAGRTFHAAIEIVPEASQPVDSHVPGDHHAGQVKLERTRYSVRDAWPTARSSP